MMPTRRRFLARTVGLSSGLCLALDTRANQLADQPEFVPLKADARQALDLGLAYLAASQHHTGGFGSRAYRGSVAVTSLAALAFMAGGNHPGRGRYAAAVERALRYVLSQQALVPGGFVYSPVEGEQARMYSHGFGTLFLAEIYGMIPDAELQRETRDALERAVQATVGSQNREGGWRYEPRPRMADVSVTICQIMALRAARNAGMFVPKSTVDACVKFVQECRTPDGGFSYFRNQGPAAFARTAAGVVALHSAGIYDGPLIERGLEYLMAHVPGSPGGSRTGPPDHFYYGHYYAALAMWTAGPRYWSRWFPAVADELVRRGSSQGGSFTWDDFRTCPEYATAMSCIILQIPKNYLPIMQA